MTQNFVPQFVPQQMTQATPIMQQPQIAPQPIVNQPTQVPPAATVVGVQPKQAGPNIWYHPVTQKDYNKISEIGTVTIVVRILPGVNQAGIYEAIFEKNVSTSKYPNSKRWLCPVMILSDMLHPERNGFVGIMEFSKTLYGKIKNSKTPANYFDFNCGHNFHIIVSLSNSKDGEQVFPNYNKSGFESQPTACQGQYAYQKMQEGKFSDFATFINRLNNPKPATTVQYNPVSSPQQPTQVQPIYTQPPVQQIPQQMQYVNQPSAQAQFVPVNAPMQQFVPQQTQQEQATGSDEEFNKIFGPQ